jgi:antitoxin VapB
MIESGMLQIRDPKVRELARKVAARDGISMTAAVRKALAAEAARPARKKSPRKALERIQAELRALAKPGGHMMTKEEIDDMWGHPPDDMDR